MIAWLRSLLRFLLRPLVRWAWCDFTEHGNAVLPCRWSGIPELVCLQVIGNTLDTEVFLLPSEARIVADELYAAAYDAAELIPVPVHEPLAA